MVFCCLVGWLVGYIKGEGGEGMEWLCMGVTRLDVTGARTRV